MNSSNIVEIQIRCRIEKKTRISHTKEILQTLKVINQIMKRIIKIS